MKGDVRRILQIIPCYPTSDNNEGHNHNNNNNYDITNKPFKCDPETHAVESVIASYIATNIDKYDLSKNIHVSLFH